MSDAVPRATEAAVLARLRCPACGGPLRESLRLGGEGRATCVDCSVAYTQAGGIWRLLTEAERRRYAPFLESYRPLRQGDGWERGDPAYYLRLPHVPPSDPTAGIWRIRRRSLARLEQIAGPGAGRWALDLGAGNGWLSRRLAERGFAVIALDLNVGGADSLEGAQVFLDHGAWFGRVQAEMDRLPLAPGAFALCVCSGALHYADLPATLAEVWRVLEPGGVFVCTDSPVYTDPAAGAAMVAEQAARLRTTFGREPHWPGGSGFLVADTLMAAMRRAGFAGQMLANEHPLGPLRHRLARLRRPAAREQARFPVVVGRKAAPVGA
jgi:SAM-dependent methyltransferase